MIVAKLRYDGVFEGTVDIEPKDGKLPKGYSFSLPPEIPEGHHAVLNGSWTIVPGSPAANPFEERLKLDQIAQYRKIRNEKLLASDWTQFADAPLTSEKKTQWADYRKALRDVPQQAGFPSQIVWPEAPQ